MSTHRRFRILLTLLTAVMVTVQAFAAGVPTCCAAVGAADVADAESCCHGPQACCASAEVCRCGRTTPERSASVCSCGDSQPIPATPAESNFEQQFKLLNLALRLPAVRTPSEGDFSPAAQQPRPAIEVGIQTLLCVWLT